jgi:hypothetical protein
VGEIKSTIDLVLEKTRDLSLSSQEKQKLARQELEKKLRGIISRYLDQLIPMDRLTEEMERTAGADKGLAMQFLKRHLLNQLDFDRDNASILTALEQAAGVDISPLTTLQQEYRSEQEAAKKEITEIYLAGLRDKGINGSAVVPNLEKDPTWRRLSDELRKRYQERLEEMEL